MATQFCPRCDGHLSNEHIRVDADFVCRSCVSIDELFELAVNLQRNLDGRDEFLVRIDQWNAFVRQLPK